MVELASQHVVRLSAAIVCLLANSLGIRQLRLVIGGAGAGGTGG